MPTFYALVAAHRYSMFDGLPLHLPWQHPSLCIRAESSYCSFHLLYSSNLVVRLKPDHLCSPFGNWNDCKLARFAYALLRNLHHCLIQNTLSSHTTLSISTSASFGALHSLKKSSSNSANSCSIDLPAGVGRSAKSAVISFAAVRRSVVLM